MCLRQPLPVVPKLPIMRRDPDSSLGMHRRTCFSFMSLGAKLMLSVPVMMLFLNHAAGYRVIAALLREAMTAPEPSYAEVSFADDGERFGVSRTHVRKLLVDAENAGLMKLHARGGHRVEILPRLWTSHDQGIAGGMYLQDLVYVAAAKDYVGRHGERRVPARSRRRHRGSKLRERQRAMMKPAKCQTRFVV
jgi:hypothetical protein